MKRLIRSLRRWWSFLQLVRHPEAELTLSPTWSSRQGRERAAWDAVRQHHGIRRHSLRPQPRAANPRGAPNHG